MSPRCAPSQTTTPGLTIQAVLQEFLEERRRTLRPAASRLYGHVLFFLELCINNYGHRNLPEPDRVRYERVYAGTEGARMDFFELFGPARLLPELDFFVETFLHQDVHTSERVASRAKFVVADLREWLVSRGYVSRGDVEEEASRDRERTRLRLRLRRLRTLLSRHLVSVDAGSIPRRDFVPCDAHPIVRLEQGRLWLQVYRGGCPEEIGPIFLPREATRRLRVGWSLTAALARLRGRWRLVELEEIYPRE